MPAFLSALMLLVYITYLLFATRTVSFSRTGPGSLSALRAAHVRRTLRVGTLGRAYVEARSLLLGYHTTLDPLIADTYDTVESYSRAGAPDSDRSALNAIVTHLVDAAGGHVGARDQVEAATRELRVSSKRRIYA